MAADTFRPLIGLRNPHLQTVLSVLLKSGRLHAATVRRLVRLPDGDALVLHDSSPRRWRATDPVALLVHGLGGSHRSGPIVRLGRLLHGRGVRVVRMDLRGAGHGMRVARGSYHAGCSEDVRAAVEAVHALAPAAPIWVAGISLGANVILKMAGEAGARPLAGLARVAAVAPPVDLAECMGLLSLPRNRFYDRQFVTGLLTETHQRARRYPDQRVPPLPKPMTLRLFDELLTAPRAGFKDAGDYYSQSSSNQFVPEIVVPTLILSARDDPFIAPGPLERMSRPACVELQMTDHGGHVGFLGADGAGGWFWGERRVADWLGNPHSSNRQTATLPPHGTPPIMPP